MKRKKQSVCSVFKIFCTYICWIIYKMQLLEVSGVVRRVYVVRQLKVNVSLCTWMYLIFCFVSLLFGFVFLVFCFQVLCVIVVYWSCYLRWHLMWCIAECFVKWSRFIDCKITDTQFAAIIHQRHRRRRYLRYTLQVQCHMEKLGLLTWIYFIKIFSIIWYICSYDMGFIFLYYFSF